MADPAQPAGPRIAVSAAIFKHQQFLLVRRARSPAKGAWTLPGGRVEFGERLEHAVNREVMEETQLVIDLCGLAGYREILPAQSGLPGGHFVILPFAARWRSGDVVLNEELDGHRWISVAELGGFATTEGLAEIVSRCEQMLWQK